MPALEKLNIDTPEQVALEFSLATVGSRFLALAIDTLIQATAGLALVMVTLLALWASGSVLAGAHPWVLSGLVVGGFLIYYAYFALFESIWNGQTPGKRVIGLRVIHASGRPVSVFEAILRNVVRIADQMPGIYALGIVSVFLTERSQRLGDLAAGTVVVHERVVAGILEELPARAAAVPLATQYGAARLAPEEVSVIELFFHRRGQLDGHVRIRRAHDIARRIRERLDVTAAIDDEQLLEEVVSEYKARGGFG